MSLARVLRNRVLRQSGLLLFFASLASTLHADESAWRVWLEPTFMRPPVSAAFVKAKKTELAAGTLTGDDLSAFSKAEFDALGWTWEQFEPLARYNAAADLPSLRYHFERDRRHVITYARVESDRPVVASVVLIPGFLDLWQETLGEKVLVVVPNRYTAYLFPRIGSNYMEYSPMIFRAYHDTAYPVSAEIFELSTEGWKCLGTYEEP